MEKSPKPDRKNNTSKQTTGSGTNIGNKPPSNNVKIKPGSASKGGESDSTAKKKGGDTSGANSKMKIKKGKVETTQKIQKKYCNDGVIDPFPESNLPNVDSLVDHNSPKQTRKMILSYLATPGSKLSDFAFHDEKGNIIKGEYPLLEKYLSFNDLYNYHHKLEIFSETGIGDKNFDQILKDFSKENSNLKNEYFHYGTPTATSFANLYVSPKRNSGFITEDSNTPKKSWGENNTPEINKMRQIIDALSGVKAYEEYIKSQPSSPESSQIDVNENKSESPESPKPQPPEKQPASPKAEPVDPNLAEELASIRKFMAELNEKLSKLSKQEEALKSPEKDYTDILERILRAVQENGKTLQELLAKIAVTEPGKEREELIKQFDALKEDNQKLFRSLEDNASKIGEDQSLAIKEQTAAFKDFAKKMDDALGEIKKQSTSATDQLAEGLKKLEEAFHKNLNNDYLKQIAENTKATESEAHKIKDGVDALVKKLGDKIEKQQLQPKEELKQFLNELISEVKKLQTAKASDEKKPEQSEVEKALLKALTDLQKSLEDINKKISEDKKDQAIVNQTTLDNLNTIKTAFDKQREVLSNLVDGAKKTNDATNELITDINDLRKRVVVLEGDNDELKNVQKVQIQEQAKLVAKVDELVEALKNQKNQQGGLGKDELDALTGAIKGLNDQIANLQNANKDQSGKEEEGTEGNKPIVVRINNTATIKLLQEQLTKLESIQKTLNSAVKSQATVNTETDRRIKANADAIKDLSSKVTQQVQLLGACGNTLTTKHVELVNKFNTLMEKLSNLENQNKDIKIPGLDKLNQRLSGLKNEINNLSKVVEGLRKLPDEVAMLGKVLGKVEQAFERTTESLASLTKNMIAEFKLLHEKIDNQPRPANPNQNQNPNLIPQQPIPQQNPNQNPIPQQPPVVQQQNVNQNVVPVAQVLGNQIPRPQPFSGAYPSKLLIDAKIADIYKDKSNDRSDAVLKQELKKEVTFLRRILNIGFANPIVTGFGVFVSIAVTFAVPPVGIILLGGVLLASLGHALYKMFVGVSGSDLQDKRLQETYNSNLIFDLYHQLQQANTKLAGQFDNNGDYDSSQIWKRMSGVINSAIKNLQNSQGYIDEGNNATGPYHEQVVALECIKNAGIALFDELNSESVITALKTKINNKEAQDILWSAMCSEDTELKGIVEGALISLTGTKAGQERKVNEYPGSIIMGEGNLFKDEDFHKNPMHYRHGRNAVPAIRAKLVYGLNSDADKLFQGDYHDAGKRAYKAQQGIKQVLAAQGDEISDLFQEDLAGIAGLVMRADAATKNAVSDWNNEVIKILKGRDAWKFKVNALEAQLKELLADVDNEANRKLGEDLVSAYAALYTKMGNVFGEIDKQAYERPIRELGKNIINLVNFLEEHKQSQQKAEAFLNSVNNKFSLGKYSFVTAAKQYMELGQLLAKSMVPGGAKVNLAGINAWLNEKLVRYDSYSDEVKELTVELANELNGLINDLFNQNNNNALEYTGQAMSADKVPANQRVIYKDYCWDTLDNAVEAVIANKRDYLNVKMGDFSARAFQLKQKDVPGEHASVKDLRDRLSDRLWHLCLNGSMDNQKLLDDLFRSLLDKIDSKDENERASAEALLTEIISLCEDINTAINEASSKKSYLDKISKLNENFIEVNNFLRGNKQPANKLQQVEAAFTSNQIKGLLGENVGDSPNLKKMKTGFKSIPAMVSHLIRDAQGKDFEETVFTPTIKELKAFGEDKNLRAQGSAIADQLNRVLEEMLVGKATHKLKVTNSDSVNVVEIVRPMPISDVELRGFIQSMEENYNKLKGLNKGVLTQEQKNQLIKKLTNGYDKLIGIHLSDNNPNKQNCSTQAQLVLTALQNIVKGTGTSAFNNSRLPELMEEADSKDEGVRRMARDFLLFYNNALKGIQREINDAANQGNANNQQRRKRKKKRKV